LREQILPLIWVALLAPWLNPFAPGPSPAVVPWLVSLLCSAIFTLLVLPSSQQHLAKVTSRAWLAAALFSAVIGLLQYFGFSGSLAPWVNRTEIGEAFGNLRQRNQFASLTNIGLAVLYWQSAVWRDVPGAPARRPGGSWGKLPPAVMSLARVAPVIAAVLLGVANAASSSRTGLMQLLLLLILVGWWGGLRRPYTRRLVVASLLSYAVASVALPLLIGFELGTSGILARLHEGAPACASRITLWGNVLHLIAQKPWFGWGWGELDFAHFITLYPGARFCEILDNAHNLPLHLAVELGIPAALLICGTGLWLVWRAQPWAERDATRRMAWGVLAVIFLHSLLEYPLWYGPFQIVFGLCVVLLCATPPQRGVDSAVGASHVKVEASIGPFALVFIRFIAIFLIAIAAYAAWDYHRISQIYLTPSQRDEAYRTHTLAKIKASWLFRNQVRFAELSITPLTPDNAARLNAMAHELLHFSPEAVVVEKLIDSAALLGKTQEVEYFKLRYQAAFPDKYSHWAKNRATP
jgi:O-antigen ligase